MVDYSKNKDIRRNPVISLIASIMLVIIGGADINKSGKLIPKFEDFHVTQGVISSVEKNSSGQLHLMICLEGNKGCYKFPSNGFVWRNAVKTLKKGLSVKLWYGGQGVPYIWQLEHDQKLLLSYKMLKWEKENERKFRLPIAYFFTTLGGLMFIIIIYKVVRNRIR